MQWLVDLFNSESVAQAVLVLSIVAAGGILIGSLKIRGVGLGVAGVLFSGLIMGHFMKGRSHGPINEHVLHFAREFGLILFVYAIGVQVGPGFFASLRKNGIRLNLMAASIVLLGVAITVGLITTGKVDVATAVGLYSGGTTNTPSLAAAQQAMKDRRRADLERFEKEAASPDPEVAAAAKAGLEKIKKEAAVPGLGYAVAYPFGIMGIIITMVLARMVFKIDLKTETESLARLSDAHKNALTTINLEVKNPNLDGLMLRQIPTLADSGVVISRVLVGGSPKVAKGETILHTGDVLLAVGTPERLNDLKLIVGSETKVDVRAVASSIITRTVVVTHSDILGKTVEELNLRERLGVAVTRVTRAAIEMPAADLPLQFGDRLLMVGEPAGMETAAREVGDSVHRLNHPEIIPIFIGIALGVLLGSLPVNVGLSAPLKLGLAGGPLVVAILLSRMGHFGSLVWYLPTSANLILKEIGIVLFLACVGLNGGGQFINTLTGPGLSWMLMAGLITIIPLLLVAAVGRIFFQVNYLTLCGLLAGSMTDPPALAFAGSVTRSDAPSVAYATVYPLVMLLRVLSGQAIVLLLLT